MIVLKAKLSQRKLIPALSICTPDCAVWSEGSERRTCGCGGRDLPSENGVAPIGDWTTRGQSAFPFPPAVASFYSSTPDFFATQYYIVEGGRTALIADGYAYFQGQNPLGALFALIGGVGAFSGAAGHAVGTPLGMNATGAPNFRITFYLHAGSVRGNSNR